MSESIKNGTIEEKKIRLERWISQKYSLDEKATIIFDNIITYAVGNAFMVGYEDTKEFLLFMLDGVVEEADTLTIMKELFGGIQ